MIDPILLSEYNKYFKAHDFHGAAESLWPILELFPSAHPDREELLMKIMEMELVAVILEWKPSSGSPNRKGLAPAKKAALLLLADDPSFYHPVSVLIDIALRCGDQSEVAESLAMAEPLLPVALNTDNSREGIFFASSFIINYSLSCLVCGRTEDAEKALSRLPSNSEYSSHAIWLLLERFGVKPTPTIRALVEN